MAVRIGVLASGGGTNLQAIIDFLARKGEGTAATLAVVASNDASAGALGRARDAGIPAETFDATDDGASLAAILERHTVDLVALAGYLKRVPASVVKAYRGRIINIHPGLLPEFGGSGMYGERVHAAVISSGATTTGVTVHMVDDEFDRGPVIAQWRLTVLENDTAASLAARVLTAEHVIYPRVVEMVATLAASDLSADF